MAEIGIGRLAALTGVKIPTIRFYEQNDLVAPPRRTEGGQRRYDESAVCRLHFIRHARDLGFSVEDIRQLLALSERPALPCDTAEQIARHHLQQVEGKIARLRLIRTELKRMIDACGGGSAADCRILDALSK
jgi:DNA-binding transcriptional MerR regulator